MKFRSLLNRLKGNDVVQYNDGTKWIQYVLVVFVLPFTIICLSGGWEWFARLVVVSVAIAAVPIVCFGTSLNPGATYIRAGGKLSGPGLERPRQIVDLVMRIIVLSFGVFFLVIIAIPFMQDCKELAANGKPARVIGTVGRNSAVPFLKQSVNLMQGRQCESQSYTLLYAIHLLKVGGQYEFWVLPRSRMILMSFEVASSG
jgi:hypothetical protein